MAVPAIGEWSTHAGGEDLAAMLAIPADAAGRLPAADAAAPPAGDPDANRET